MRKVMNFSFYFDHYCKLDLYILAKTLINIYINGLTFAHIRWPYMYSNYMN
jgi:hypothetical protein